MKLAIMQPYFFPHLSHFALIANTDAWIVFDITQYTPRSWMNRNRILHPEKGWNYITIPLSNSSISIKTHEARILNFAATYKTILGKLSHYRKKAPYFFQVKSLIQNTFAENTDSLVSLNVRGLQIVCDYLKLSFNFSICSTLQLQLPQSMSPGKWALTIAKLVGATDYVNPIGGRHIFDPADYAAQGIGLSFLDMPNFSYNTNGHPFESNLSILDVLMWNDPNTVREAIFKSQIIPSHQDKPINIDIK